MCVKCLADMSRGQFKTFAAYWDDWSRQCNPDMKAVGRRSEAMYLLVRLT